MRALAARIGLYRVAAILIACALALEIVRVRLATDSTAGTVTCTFGEVLFLGVAAGVFVIARRNQTSRR